MIATLKSIKPQSEGATMQMLVRVPSDVIMSIPALVHFIDKSQPAAK